MMVIYLKLCTITSFVLNNIFSEVNSGCHANVKESGFIFKSRLFWTRYQEMRNNEIMLKFQWNSFFFYIDNCRNKIYCTWVSSHKEDYYTKKKWWLISNASRYSFFNLLDLYLSGKLMSKSIVIPRW